MRALLCLLPAFAIAGWTLVRADPPSELPPIRTESPAQPYGLGTLAGVPAPSLSCSAAACHGGGQVGRVGSEHTTWAPELTSTGIGDPHSRAYRVLFHEDSVRIAKNLGRRPAHQDALCLKCHATAGVQEEAALAEGVGCAACHGPSENWLTTHYLPGWKALSTRDKAAHGFVPTDNLVARISNCATCHVGSTDREVNHDLIAAGHPRLAFEYSRFHYNPHYRKHWIEEIPQPDFETRAWVVGQAVSLRAAVEVLAGRATRAAKNDPDTPWPEFAGQSCYACHQGIGGPTKGVPVGTRKLGWPGWEVWYASAAKPAMAAASEIFPGVPAPPLAEVAALEKMMGSPNPRPAAAAAEATKLLAEFDRWLAALQAAEDHTAAARLAPGTSRKLVSDLAAHALDAKRERLRDHDWDFLAAHYLGCGAMFHATGGSAMNPDLAGPIHGLDEALRFPPRIGRTRFDSPAGFDRSKIDSVRNSFGRLLGE